MGIGRSKQKIHCTRDEGNIFIGTLDEFGNGHGKIVFEDNSIFIGNIRENLLNGHGTCSYTDGSIYEGYWKNGVRDGNGIMYFISGDIYEGNFDIDEINGKGKYIYNDKSFYIGEFKFGKRFGSGTQYNSEGIIQYAGEWQFDCIYRGNKRKIVPSVSFEPTAKHSVPRLDFNKVQSVSRVIKKEFKPLTTFQGDGAVETINPCRMPAVSRVPQDIELVRITRPSAVLRATTNPRIPQNIQPVEVVSSTNTPAFTITPRVSEPIEIINPLRVSTVPDTRYKPLATMIT